MYCTEKCVTSIPSPIFEMMSNSCLISGIFSSRQWAAPESAGEWTVVKELETTYRHWSYGHILHISHETHWLHGAPKEDYTLCSAYQNLFSVEFVLYKWPHSENIVKWALRHRQRMHIAASSMWETYEANRRCVLPGDVIMHHKIIFQIRPYYPLVSLVYFYPPRDRLQYLGGRSGSSALLHTSGALYGMQLHATLRVRDYLISSFSGLSECATIDGAAISWF